MLTFLTRGGASEVEVAPRDESATRRGSGWCPEAAVQLLTGRGLARLIGSNNQAFVGYR